MDNTTFVQIPGYSIYGINLKGNVKNLNTNRNLSVQRYPNGYFYYHLIDDGGNHKSCLRHRILMMTFCPMDNLENLWVNHINGIKGDDRLENLEWVTPQQNCEKAGEIGLSSKCIPISVLDSISGEIIHYPSATAAGKALGLTKDAILYRLTYPETQVFPELKQYRRRDDSREWKPTDNPYLISKQYGITKSVLARDLRTKEIFEFASCKELAILLKMIPGTLCSLLQKFKQPVLNSGYQIKFNDGSEWEEINLIEGLAKRYKIVEVYDTETNSLCRYLTPSHLALIEKSGNTTILYRISTQGRTIFSNGKRYAYYPTLTNQLPCPVVQECATELPLIAGTPLEIKQLQHKDEINLDVNV